MQTPKVAIIHDQLTAFGGAERVVKSLLDMFPEAELFTSIACPHLMGHHWEDFATVPVHQSWARHLPFVEQKLMVYQLLGYSFFSGFRLDRFDLVLSSCVWFSKAVKTPLNVPHICYCHTPSKALYGYEYEAPSVKKTIRDILWMPPLMRYLDRKAARGVNYFVANSQHVRGRVKDCYQVDAHVVYPPITIPAKAPLSTQKRAGIVTVGRHVPSKHLDLAIQACNQLALPLTVVGTGPCTAQLRALAGPTIRFVGDVGDDELDQLYSQAQVVMYPAENEDFGMVPVEAMARGTPVVATAAGGILETVLEEKTGCLFDTLHVEEVVRALSKALETDWDHQVIYEHALRFSSGQFQTDMKRIIERALNG